MKGLRVIQQVLHASDMVTRTVRRPDQSLRDFPLYTISEAALYLAMPKATLRYWVCEHPLWHIAGGDLPTTLLSFRDLTQAYYVEVVRHHYKLSLNKAREIIEQAKKESRSKYPLLEDNILLFNRHVIMDKRASKRQPRRLVDLTSHRQLALEPVIQPFATRVRWSTQGITQIYPWRYWSGESSDTSRPVSISPEIMSGKLVVTGTRIPVEVIAERRSQDESVSSIARDYHLPEDSIKQALRHLVPQAT
jgi:uncharacterized protein (DUF433 family)